MKPELSSKCIRNSKKSQTNIKEMIFVLIFIFFFFIIVFLFYITTTMSGIKTSVYESQKDRALMLVMRIADSPELSCGAGNSIDMDKLVIFKEHTIYKNFWKIDGLVIKKLLPYSNETIECTIGNYPNCNTFTVIKPINDSVADANFVSLCRTDTKNGYNYKRWELGRIMIYTSDTRNE